VNVGPMPGMGGGAPMMVFDMLHAFVQRDREVPMTEVECPVCSATTHVALSQESGAPETFACRCGTVINSEAGCFTRPIPRASVPEQQTILVSSYVDGRKQRAIPRDVAASTAATGLQRMP
jgi:hypothetical protein